MDESTDNPMVGDFVGGFNVKSPVDLILGISDGNKKQQGKDLKAFVDMVNFMKIKIKSVEIMVTAYIQRHYHGEEEALRRRDSYIAENQEILKGLKIPFTITDWKTIIETEDFKHALFETKELYETDNAFRVKIDNLSQSHRQKASPEKCKEYVLEEAAYFLYKKVHVCYPADNLNIACVHIIENYNKDAVFHGYRFKPKFSPKIKSPKLTENTHHSNYPTVQAAPIAGSPIHNFSYLQPSYTKEDLFFDTISLARIMGKIGLIGNEDKIRYFQNVLTHNEQFMSQTTRESSNEGTTTNTSQPTKISVNY